MTSHRARSQHLERLQTSLVSLAETAFIQSFNLASLFVGQLLVATHFTHLLPEKKEASLQVAGLFF